jgi:hypothetical protein
MLRNAVIVVTNGEQRDALPAVRRLLRDDSPVLVEVASWCLMRLRDRGATPLLEQALARPLDPTIRELVRDDLGVLGASSS